MIVYGKNTCEEILKSSEKIKKIYLDRNFSDKNIISLVEKKDLKPVFYTKAELDEVADGNHQGIIIDMGEYNYCDIDDIIDDNGFIVILDHLEDTHNFGAIIRTCEAAGVSGIIIPKDRSVRVNSTVMKTSSGAAIRMKICMVTNINQTIKYLQDKDYYVTSTDMGGETYTKVDYTGNTAIVIGNEGSGVAELTKKLSDYVVSIPMIGKIDSLNASVAAGILIYEVVRQRSI